MLTEAYSKYFLLISMWDSCFVRFNGGDFEKEENGQSDFPKNFVEDELMALLHKNCCHTEKLVKSLEYTQAETLKRLQAEIYPKARKLNIKDVKPESP